MEGIRLHTPSLVIYAIRNEMTETAGIIGQCRQSPSIYKLPTDVIVHTNSDVNRFVQWILFGQARQGGIDKRTQTSRNLLGFPSPSS